MSKLYFVINTFLTPFRFSDSFPMKGFLVNNEHKFPFYLQNHQSPFHSILAQDSQ